MIAVVDDEESVRKAIARLLTAAGYAARSFASGTEFLDQGMSEPPECLILDLQMPGLSGVEVQRALNRCGARIPVLMLSAGESSGAREECLREGAAAYLCKPVDERILFNALSSALTAEKAEPADA
jgi:FixJ family two-component response regulator